MNKLFLILFLLLASSLILPVYAEVTSLQTNTVFYKGGSKIHFSGTTLDSDPPYITVLIFDPNNQFKLLASGSSNSSHQFEIIIDTSTQDNQQKFSLKGIYNATAFIANKTAGKTVNFVFSPDGSPVLSSPPTGLVTTVRSSTEIDLRWSAPTLNGGSTIAGYKIERNDGLNFNTIQNTQSTSYQDTGLSPNKQYSYRVSAINSAGSSNPSNVVYATTLSLSTQTNSQGSSGQTSQGNIGSSNQQQSNPSSIDQIIQQRIENAKRLQQLLQAKTKEISFHENIGVRDAFGNPSLSQSSPFPNNTTGFDFNTILYPLIILAGIGIVIAVLYGKKNRLWFSSNPKPTNENESAETREPVEIGDEQTEEDYSLMILKNRLAKGEISIEEFNELKDALTNS